MKLKTSLTFSLLMLFSFCSVSQVLDTVATKQPLNQNKLHYVYIDLSAFVNPNFGIQLGYERSLIGGLSAVIEATFLAKLWTDMSGYKVMISPRYYLNDRIFLGVEGVHKTISADRFSFFDLGTHFQRLHYTSTIKLNYAAMQFGVEFPTSDKRVFFEMAGSIGGGRRQVIHTGTNGYELLEEPVFGLGWFPKDDRIPYLNLALKIKVCLNKL